MKKRLLLTIVAILSLFVAARAFTEPGSEKDPLVSLSYVDRKIDQLKNYIDQKLSGTGGNSSNEEGAWVVVELEAGQSLICYGGTEIILRAGDAKAISVVAGNVENGLTDITIGRDLKGNEDITQNHLLIIPRRDGRGAYSVNHTYWLVKGDYEIK